jgi:hypothetical protein
MNTTDKKLQLHKCLPVLAKADGGWGGGNREEGREGESKDGRKEGRDMDDHTNYMTTDTYPNESFKVIFFWILFTTHEYHVFQEVSHSLYWPWVTETSHPYTQSNSCL